MSLSTRRALYIFFILIFFTITPLIMLYAAGYSLSGGLKVQKTGILIVDTIPSGAKIVIDGKTQQNLFNKIFNIDETAITTPAKVKNLIPGEYNITLSKEGYSDWQKKLSIRPGESTYIEDVSLFKKDSPLIIASGMYEKNALSPNKEYAVFASAKDLVLYNLNSDETQIYSLTALSALKSALPDLIWSPNSKNIIFNNTLFSVKDFSNPIDLDKLIGTNINRISWDENSDILYYLSGNILQKYNISTKETQAIIENTNLKNYYVQNNILYFFENTVSSNDIIAWNIKENKISASISLPVSEYTFLADDNKDFINVYDNSHQILYLIDPQITYKQIRESISNVIFSKWIDNNKLLYANKHEIWLFDLKNRKNTLLTRISQEITDTIWHPSNNYIIYSTPKDIFTIELDDREKYNITKIIELETIKNLLLSEKGDELFFYSKIGSQEGIFKLVIQ